MLQFTITHSYTLSGHTADGEHHLVVDQPSPYAPRKFLYDDSVDSDEHQFAKRRFNAWAGKRNLMAKRRFNAWAGKRSLLGKRRFNAWAGRR